MSGTEKRNEKCAGFSPSGQITALLDYIILVLFNLCLLRHEVFSVLPYCCCVGSDLLLSNRAQQSLAFRCNVALLCLNKKRAGFRLFKQHMTA